MKGLDATPKTNGNVQQHTMPYTMATESALNIILFTIR